MIDKYFKNFSVPLNEPSRSKWIQSIEKYQIFDHVIQTYHVCSLHFSPEDIITTGKRNMVVRGRIPTIFPSNEQRPHMQAGDKNDSPNSCDSELHSMAERDTDVNANDVIDGTIEITSNQNDCCDILPENSSLSYGILILIFFRIVPSYLK